MAYKAADEIPEAMDAIKLALGNIPGNSKKSTVLINKYSKVFARTDYMSGDITFIILK